MDEYTKDLYSSRQQVDLDNGNGDHKAEPDQSDLTISEPKNWLDYRVEAINTSSAANLLTISQFSDCLLSAESFGNGKATIQHVELLESTTERPLLVGRGGEKVTLKIQAVAKDRIVNPIVGFLLKNEKGLTLLGDNSLNSLSSLLGTTPPETIAQGENYSAEFEFTLPLLPRGRYSFTISLAEGTQEDHQQLQWMNDALIFESTNCSIAAGLAGVPMHRITLTTSP